MKTNIKIKKTEVGSITKDHCTIMLQTTDGNIIYITQSEGLEIELI